MIWPRAPGKKGGGRGHSNVWPSPRKVDIFLEMNCGEVGQRPNVNTQWPGNPGWFLFFGWKQKEIRNLETIIFIHFHSFHAGPRECNASSSFLFDFCCNNSDLIAETIGWRNKKCFHLRDDEHSPLEEYQTLMLKCMVISERIPRNNHECLVTGQKVSVEWHFHLLNFSAGETLGFHGRDTIEPLWGIFPPSDPAACSGWSHSSWPP